MNNIKFNEWQEMSLKKDVENIIKRLDAREPIFLSLCLEIVIAIGSIIVDHFFDAKNIPMWVWILCAVIAITPPVLIVFRKLAQWIRAVWRVNKGDYSVKQFIDVFDNQVCYWVMICDSYRQMLQDEPVEVESERIKNAFLFQECCYYNNKSIQELYKMAPVLEKICSSNQEDIVRKGLVASYRLINIMRMLIMQREYLDERINTLGDVNLIGEQRGINDIVKGELKRLINDINELYSADLEY